MEKTDKADEQYLEAISVLLALASRVGCGRVLSIVEASRYLEELNAAMKDDPR